LTEKLIIIIIIMIVIIIIIIIIIVKCIEAIYAYRRLQRCW